MKLQERAVAKLLAATLIVAAIVPARADEDSVQRAVNQADRFLRTEQRGKDILDYLHFGASYRGHQYVKTLPVFDRSGDRMDGWFSLVYRFHWEDDGVTDVGFRCDPSGHLYDVRIMYTNARFSPPFTLANLAIQALGNLLIQANKEKMDPLDRKLVQKFVDDADAKGLLEWSLKFHQFMEM
jgi:hypothetical protein